MIIKYAIALAILIILAAAFRWAFLPARHLPGNRVRHLRIRLHLRLHPGKGFATVFGLWLRWGRFAGVAPLKADPPVLAAVAADAGPGGALGVLGPGALAARSADPA